MNTLVEILFIIPLLILVWVMALGLVFIVYKDFIE